MRLVFVGSIVAAVVMSLTNVLFALFYVTPLCATPYRYCATTEQIAAHQSGPIPTIKYNSHALMEMSGDILIFSFGHMLISAFIIGVSLWKMRNHVTDFRSRLGLVLWFSLAMAVYIRLDELILYDADRHNLLYVWYNAVYLAAADFATFAMAGAILARWFVPNRGVES